MEELDLTKILKNAPIGTKLYSPIFGECELNGVTNDLIYISGKHGGYLNKNGTYYEGCGECQLFPSKDNRDWNSFNVNAKNFSVGDHVIDKATQVVYFLSRKTEQGDDFWAKHLSSQFDEGEFLIDKAELFNDYEKVGKFDTKWLKPFDRVLVRNYTTSKWRVNFFSHNEFGEFPHLTIDDRYKCCIPFNEETKYLVGTMKEEPNFYKI